MVEELQLKGVGGVEIGRGGGGWEGAAVLLDLSSLHVGKIPSWLINVAINKIAPSVSLHLPPAGMLTCSYCR